MQNGQTSEQLFTKYMHIVYIFTFVDHVDL